MPLAAGQHRGAFCDGVSDMAFNFRKTLVINDRALFNALLQTIANLHGGTGLGQPPGKFIIDTVLHEQAVGTDAGLAGIAVF